MTTAFENTRKALAEYDADTPRRDKLWADIESDEDVFDAELSDKIAADKVREAFYEDTKNINSKEACMRVWVDDIRKIVEEQ